MVRYTREPSEVRVWTMAEVVRPIAAVVSLIALVTLYCTLSMDRYLMCINTYILEKERESACTHVCM